MRARKVAYYLSDCTFPFYVEYEFDAIPFSSFFKEAALSQTSYKREMLFLKMFAVRKSIDLHLAGEQAERLWRLVLGEMERIYDSLFPKDKEAIKADLPGALATYGEACSRPGATPEEIVGKCFAARLGLPGEPRLARYATNMFGRKTSRCDRYLSRRIWFQEWGG